MEVAYVLQVHVKEHVIRDWLKGDGKLSAWLNNVEDFSKPMFYTTTVIGALSNKLLDARIYRTPNNFGTIRKHMENTTFIEKVEVRKISLELLKDA